MTGDPPRHDPVPEARTHFLYVLLPGDLDPGERHERYATMLDAELQLAGVGYVSGGGSCFSLDGDDDDEAMFCGVDIDATDVDTARAILREHLPELGCPIGTHIQYREDDRPMQDEFDGSDWVTGRPRTDLHPAFDL